MIVGKARDPCSVMDEATPLIVESSLPRVIHNLVDYSKGVSFPRQVEKWHKSFADFYPDHVIIMWDDDMLLEFMKDEFPWFLPYYVKYPRNIQRVDAARYFLLYKYGGLYADMDMEVHADFWDRLPDDIPAVIESSWLHERTQNAFMSSPRSHEFWQVTWDLMMTRANVTQRAGDVIWTTGPGMLDDAIAIYDKGRDADERVRILPCENWNRMSVSDHVKPGRAWDTHTARQFGKSRLCGDIEDKGPCLLTEHHGMITWVDSR